MLKEEDITTTYIYRVTGWSFTRSVDGTISIKGNQTHVSKPGGPYYIFIDGKLLKDIDAIISLLLQNGIIKNKRNLAL